MVSSISSTLKHIHSVSYVSLFFFIFYSNLNWYYSTSVYKKQWKNMRWNANSHLKCVSGLTFLLLYNNRHRRLRMVVDFPFLGPCPLGSSCVSILCVPLCVTVFIRLWVCVCVCDCCCLLDKGKVCFAILHTVKQPRVQSSKFVFLHKSSK